MLTTSLAFKEWAVVCDALAAAEQIVILRKGGIAELGGSFEPRNEPFLLLPTFEHQSPQGLKSQFQNRLAPLTSQDSDTDSIRVELVAHPQQAIRVTSEAALQAIRDEHIWSDALIQERFHRWQDAGVWAIPVHVFRLHNPVSIPFFPEYRGCKSWVDIDELIPIDDAQPVLNSDDFQRRLANLARQLQSHPS